MKKIIFFFFLLNFSLQAQNVQFADATFKEALIDIGVDENKDNEIQVSEAEAVTYLDFINYTFFDLTGLEAFVNVTEIEFESVIGIDTMLLQNLPKLEVLTIRGLGDLTTLAFSNLPTLKKVTLGQRMPIERIDFTPLTNLEALSIINVDALKSIDCSNMPSLRFFEQKSNNNLVEVDFTGTKNIEVFIYFNHGGSDSFHVDESWTVLRQWHTSLYKNVDIDLPNLPQLEELFLSNLDQTEALDLTHYTTLKKFVMTSMDNLRDLNLNGLPNLEYLELNAMWDLRALEVINLPKLEEARLEVLARASAITLSKLPSLEILKLNNMGRVRRIELSDAKITQFEIFSGPDCEELIMENIDPEIVWIDGLDKVKKMDLSAFSKMRFLRIWNNDGLEALITKNGVQKVPYEVRKNSSINYICCDDFNVTSVNFGLETDGIVGCEVDTNCGLVSAVDDLIQKANIEITPTISADIFSIQSELPISQIGLVAANGRQVELFSNFRENYNIDLSIFNYPSGIYFLQIYTPDGVVSRKIVKL